MFYHDDELQYEVEVEEPDPRFAKMLQQAIGGAEGEFSYGEQPGGGMPDLDEIIEAMHNEIN